MEILTIIFDILATIAFFVLFIGVPGGEKIPVTGEFVPYWGCGTKIVVALVCIIIMAIALFLNGIV